MLAQAGITVVQYWYTCLPARPQVKAESGAGDLLLICKGLHECGMLEAFAALELSA
jgi:hypothetical protein